MDKYIGTKLIEAEPMNLGDYNKYRGWTIPENENPEREGYLVKYEDGYESWSPKEIFEKAYNDVNTCMNFGQAIELMKLGCKVARQGWNGKGMWICLGEGRIIKADEFWNNNTRKFALDQKEQVARVLPYIVMKTADDKILMGWLASQTDMLSNDWVIVE